LGGRVRQVRLGRKREGADDLGRGKGIVPGGREDRDRSESDREQRDDRGNAEDPSHGESLSWRSVPLGTRETLVDGMRYRVASADYRSRMKGDRIEALVDTGQGVQAFEISATRAGRRVEVTTSRGVVEVREVTRSGQTVRTGRFMTSRLIALVEHPAADERARVEITTRHRIQPRA
jgi:hypothetical protein